MDPVAGQYWLADANGLDSLPVVICDEEMVQLVSADSWRPPSARQADGGWLLGYENGGSANRERTFPALFLGRTRLFWVSRYMLRPINRRLSFRRRQFCIDKMLHWAYSKILEEPNPRDLTYWQTELFAQRVRKADDRREEAQFTTKSRKSKKISVRNSLYARRGHFLDRRDDKRVRLQEANKGTHHDFMSRADIDSLYEDPEPPPPRKDEKRKQVEAEYTEYSSSSGERSPPENDWIPVYVNNQLNEFYIPRDSVCLSRILQDHLVESSTGKSCVKGQLLSRMPEMVFNPVSEFLNIGDHSPRNSNLLVMSNPQQVAFEMAGCATTYCTARILQIPAMLKKTWPKLKLLELICTRADFLDAISLIFGESATTAAADAAASVKACTSEDGRNRLEHEMTEVETEFEVWVIARLAAAFWDLMSAETQRLIGFLKANERLAQQLFWVLSKATHEEFFDANEDHCDDMNEQSEYGSELEVVV